MKFALNKNKTRKNPFPLVRMNNIRQKIRFHQPERLLLLLGTEKLKETGLYLTSVMLSSSRKKALNKGTRFGINSVSTSRKKATTTCRNICKHPRKRFQRAEILFFFKNWPTLNFMNGVRQQKKALNKSKRFLVNEKPFPLARMKDQLKNTISVEQKTSSI